MSLAHAGGVRKLLYGDGRPVIFLYKRNGSLDAVCCGALRSADARRHAVLHQCAERRKHGGFYGKLKKRRAVFQHCVRGLERGGNAFVQSSSGSDQPRHGQLAVQNGLYVLYANDVICGAAQQIGAEHDGFKVKLLAGFHRHGGVQLSAVEKHNVSGVGLKQIGAALHGQRALHHADVNDNAAVAVIIRIKYKRP